jgi:hypothetical protein
MAKAKATLHLVENTDYKLIEKVLNKGSQSLTYREIFSLAEKKFKIIIKSDSYRSQCHAEVHALDLATLKWNIVYMIHYSNMETPESLYYVNKSQNEFFACFTKDRDNLMKMLKELIA